MATITKRGKSWQLNWSEGGIQSRRSLGTVSKAEAEQAKLQKEIELGQANDQAPYFNYYAAEYLKWYQVNYPDSFERTCQIILGHLSPFFGHLTLSNIGGRHVRDYQIKRSKAKTATYLKEFRTLKAMLNRAVEWEYLTSNPIDHVKAPKLTDSKPPHFYTKDELQRLYEVPSSYRWQWQFMVNTGLRLSEAMNINLRTDIKDNSIHIVSISGARTKSGKWREVPLFTGAREALEHFDTHLFDVNPKSVSRAFKRDALRAELGGSLHSLRHTFASHLAMSGKFSLIEIQSWLGHASVTTTQKYQHLIPNYRNIDTGAIDL